MIMSSITDKTVVKCRTLQVEHEYEIDRAIVSAALKCPTLQVRDIGRLYNCVMTSLKVWK